jgi:hypothetical protein
VTFHPVKTMDEVLALALRASPVAAPAKRRVARAAAPGAIVSDAAH